MITLLFILLIFVTEGSFKVSEFPKCPFAGHNDWITNDNKICYLFMEERKDWYKAEEYCFRFNAKLVSIHDNKTNQFIFNVATNSINQWSNIWLGLNSLDKKGDYKWFDNSPNDYNNFETQLSSTTIKPSITKQLGRCVALRKNDGKWYYENCYVTHEFLCQKSDFPSISTTIPSGNCAEGWFELTHKKCIKIIDSKLTRDKALEKCLSLNGELVSIHSFEEQNFITTLMYNKSSAWIGFEKSRESFEEWFWTDQSLVSYTNWAEANAVTHWINDEDCAYILSSEIQAGNWFKSSCYSKNLSAICQTDKDPSIQTKPSPPYKRCDISGYENFTKYLNSCYLLSNSSESWDSALNICKSMNSELVSILDSYEYAFVTYFTQQFLTNDQIWIGFYANYVNSSEIFFKWSDKMPNYVSYWAEKQPLIDGTHNKTCVYQNSSSGQWITDVCDKRKSFMCKVSENKPLKSNDSEVGYCPKVLTNISKSSWVDIYEKSKYCFWFSVENKSDKRQWTDASHECSKRGGKLTSFHSSDDLRLISQIIQKAKYETWIGLYNQTSGILQWDDDSIVDFTYFADEELIDIKRSKDICAAVRKSDLKWIFRDCSSTSYEFDFICQIKKVYKSINSSTNSPTTELYISASNKTITTSLSFITPKTISNTTQTSIQNSTKSTVISNFTSKLTSIALKMTEKTTTEPLLRTTNSTSFKLKTSTSSLTINTTISSIRKYTNSSLFTTININKTDNTTHNNSFTTKFKTISTHVKPDVTTNTITTNDSTERFSNTANEGPKDLTAPQIAAIAILSFALCIGTAFGIYYIIKVKNVKRNTKLDEITLSELGIKK